MPNKTQIRLSFPSTTGDIFWDVPPGQAVGLNLAINDLAELDSRQAEFAHTLQMPRSKLNIKSAKRPETNDTTGHQYEKATAFIWQDGVLVLENGTAVINSAGQFYNINIKGGNATFFNDIQNKSLQALDLSAYDGTWNLTNFQANDAATSGLIYPIIQYGPIDPDSGSTVDIRYCLPAIHFVDVINKIISTAGYTKDGDLFTDSFLAKVIMPVVGKEWNMLQAATDERNLALSMSADQNLGFTGISSTNKTGNATVEFDTESPTSSIFDTSTYTFTETRDKYYRQDVTINYDLDVTGGSGETITVTFDFLKNGSTVLQTDSNNHTVDATGQLLITLDTGLYATGDDITCRISYAVNIGGVAMDLDIQVNSASSTWTTKAEPYILFNEGFTGEELVPDMQQTELFKSFLKLGGGFLYTDSAAKKLYVRTWDNITTNKLYAPDWSSKFDWTQTPEISWNWGRFGQTNYFQWLEDEGTTTDTGRGSMTIANTNLPPEAVQVQMPFAGSDTKPVLSSQYRVAEIPKYTYNAVNTTWESTENAKPRLLYRIAETASLTLSDDGAGGSTTAWNRAVFIDPSETNNLGFDNSLLTDYYSGLDTSTDTMQRVKCHLRLTAKDIEGLRDMTAANGSGWFVPKYLNVSRDGIHINGYYFVNRVVNFVGDGRSTEVDLIRL